MYGSIAAAGRSLLDQGAPAPLLRLYTQTLALDEPYLGQPVAQYSVELYMAVSCLDYPQLYDMSSTPAQRLAQLSAAKAALGTGTFSPFTTNEWLGMEQNNENFTACLDWPRPEIAEPPVRTRGRPLLPATLPVLILGGELDTWTPPSGVAQVRAELGGRSRFIELANETHVVAEGDTYGCASSLVRRFVLGSAHLGTLDASCAPRIPSVRAVGTYPHAWSGVPPLQPGAGTKPDAGTKTVRSLLQLASAGVMTAGDAFERHQELHLRTDRGLYGGRVVRQHRRLLLTGDELVPGVAVSGVVTYSGSTSGTVTANLVVTTARVPPLVHATWPAMGGSAQAQVSASATGVQLKGTMAAS